MYRTFFLITLSFVVLMSCSVIPDIEDVQKEVAQYAATSPNEGVWAAEMELLVEFEGTTHGYRNPRIEGGVLNLDIFVRKDNWFASIVSIRSDSMGIYRPAVGFFAKGRINYRRPKPARVVMRDSVLTNYVRLLKNDSLWTLLGEDRFWESDLAFADIYVNGTMREDPSGEISWLTMSRAFRKWSDHEILILNLEFLPQDDRALSIGELHLEDQRQGDSAELDSLISTQARVEYALGLEDWYAIVISTRTDSAGKYRPIIGRRVGDSLEYRLAGTGDYRLEGERMEKYLRLVSADSLWILVSPEPLGSAEADWQNLYDSIGRIRLPDGSPRQTRYLDISLPEPTDSA